MAHEASQYAALILGPQPSDPVSHARMETLSKTLGRDSVLRVDLPSKQVRTPQPPQTHILDHQKGETLLESRYMRPMRGFLMLYLTLARAVRDAARTRHRQVRCTETMVILIYAPSPDARGLVSRYTRVSIT